MFKIGDTVSHKKWYGPQYVIQTSNSDYGDYIMCMTHECMISWCYDNDIRFIGNAKMSDYKSVRIMLTERIKLE